MAFAGMVSTSSLKPSRVTEVDVQAVVPAGIVSVQHNISGQATILDITGWDN